MTTEKVATLKQYCFNFLLKYRDYIPKNVKTIYEIPEIREQFVSLAKRKNLVDDQFFSVFGDIFILTGANANTTTPYLNQSGSAYQHNYGGNIISNISSSTIYQPDGDVEMTPPSNDYPTSNQLSSNNNISNVYNNNLIHEIDLTGLVRITDLSIQYITKYNNLQHLNLSFCTGISIEFIRVLATNENIQLQSLNLYYTNTNDQSIQSIVYCYPNLKSLSIAGCQNVTETGIKSLAKCQSLTYLDISHIRKLSSSITKHLAFPNLIYLNASWLGPDSKEPSFSKCIKGCPKLQSLAIASSGISESELQKILTEAKRLVSLDISYCPQSITSVDSKCLKHLNNIQTLSLAGCSFKEPVLKKIIECTPNLKDLDLSNQEGILPWSFLACIISDPQILEHLHTLNLSHSKFDRFDVDILLQYPSLNIYLPSI